MALYVGLDVSLRTVSVCIVEAKGKVVWEGKVLCEGPALITALAPYRKKIKFVGIEAGPLSEWLFGILTECHFNAVCIESPWSVRSDGGRRRARWFSKDGSSRKRAGCSRW